MNANQAAYVIALFAIASIIGTSFMSCSTLRSPSPEEVRKHADSDFDRLEAEERAKKDRARSTY